MHSALTADYFMQIQRSAPPERKCTHHHILMMTMKGLISEDVQSTSDDSKLQS